MYWKPVLGPLQSCLFSRLNKHSALSLSSKGKYSCPWWVRWPSTELAHCWISLALGAQNYTQGAGHNPVNLQYGWTITFLNLLAMLFLIQPRTLVDLLSCQDTLLPYSQLTLCQDPLSLLCKAAPQPGSPSMFCSKWLFLSMCSIWHLPSLNFVRQAWQSI